MPKDVVYGRPLRTSSYCSADKIAMALSTIWTNKIFFVNYVKKSVKNNINQRQLQSTLNTVIKVKSTKKPDQARGKKWHWLIIILIQSDGIQLYLITPLPCLALPRLSPIKMNDLKNFLSLFFLPLLLQLF